MYRNIKTVGGGFLILLILILVQAQDIYTTVEPDLSLDLSKTTYNPNEYIEGDLALIFEGPIPSSTTVRVRFDDTDKTYTIKEFLSLFNLIYRESDIAIEATNPTTVKTLIFSAAGSQNFAFKIPKGSEVTTTSMSITGMESGNGSSYPQNPSLDVGVDGTKEWEYFGGLAGFSNTSIYPASLSTADEGTPLDINTNLTYHCEIINIPSTKDIQVSAKYKRVNDGGDLRAVIFSYTTSPETAYGGSDFCDLPESTTLDWHSCNIEFSTPIQGNHLVCVRSFTGQGLTFYELSRDSTSASSSYNCEYSPYTPIECVQRSFNDFFIRINEGEYATGLEGATDISEWATQYDFNASLTDYLSTCTPDADGYYCVVPVEASSSSGGKLYFSNLVINYIEPDLTSSHTEQFYDVSQLSNTIYEMNGSNMSNLTLTVSLSDFSLQTPTILNDSLSATLYVTVTPGPQEQATVMVISTELPSEVEDTEAFINSTKNYLTTITTDPNTQDILSILALDDPINSALTTLAEYETEIATLKSSNLSKSEKTSQSTIIATKVNNLVINLPKRITVTEIVKDMMIVEPEDIINDILSPEQRSMEVKQEIYQLQNNVNINLEAKVFDITPFSGSTETKTLVKKSIVSRVQNAYIIELIPKTIASSVSNINIKTEGYEIIEDDPILKWPITGETTKIVYIVPDNILANIDDTKTVVIPEIVKIKPKISYKCGDGNCTIPFENEENCPEDCQPQISQSAKTFIIVIAVVSIMGLIFLNFYKGKVSEGIKSLFQKKQPLFASDADLNNLRGYVQNALNQKVSKKEIINVLLKKGWTQKQINFVFKHLK